MEWIRVLAVFANQETEKQRRQGGRYGQLSRYSSIIFLLPSCLLMGYLLGSFLDQIWESSPRMSMITLLVCGVVGLVQVYRMLSR